MQCNNKTPSDIVTNVLKIRGSQSPFLLIRPCLRPNKMTSSIKMEVVETSFVPVALRMDFNTWDLTSPGDCLKIEKNCFEKHFTFSLSLVLKKILLFRTTIFLRHMDLEIKATNSAVSRCQLKKKKMSLSPTRFVIAQGQTL